MDVDFTRFLTLSVSHDWYGEAPPLAIRPCADAADALRAARCRMRGDGADAAVWSSDDDGVAPARDMGGPPLLFRIDAAEPLFTAATAAPWRGGWTPGATLVFPASALQRGGAVDPGAGVPLPVRGPVFAHAFETPCDGVVAVVSASSGAEVWSSPAPGYARRACDVNLSAAPEGRYELRAAGAPPVPFLMLRAGDAPLAVMEVDPAQAAARRFTGGADLRYAITFEARRLPWVYRIFAPPGVDLTGAQIGAAFGAGESEIVRGRRVMVFTSGEAMALGAGPFTLSPGDGDFTPVKLPQAGPGAVARAGPAGAPAFVMNVHL